MGHISVSLKVPYAISFSTFSKPSKCTIQEQRKGKETTVFHSRQARSSKVCFCAITSEKNKEYHYISVYSLWNVWAISSAVVPLQ